MSERHRVIKEHTMTPQTTARARALGLKSLFSVALAVAATALLGMAPAALAAGPAWSITSQSFPTNLPLGDQTGADVYMVVATNVGNAPTSGPITLTDTLPADLTVDTAGPDNYEGGVWAKDQWNNDNSHGGHLSCGAAAPQRALCTRPRLGAAGPGGC